MAIKSHAFGRVTLTKDDAKKFSNQVTFGRPSKAAVDSLSRGKKLVKEMGQAGDISVKVSLPAKKEHA